MYPPLDGYDGSRYYHSSTLASIVRAALLRPGEPTRDRMLVARYLRTLPGATRRMAYAWIVWMGYPSIDDRGTISRVTESLL